MDFSKGVLFDPGYSKFTVMFSTNIDAAYNMIFSMKSIQRRKFKFNSVYPQILKLVEHTVGFYLGCLLWASFITNNFKNEPKDILDNCYLGMTVNEEEMLFEVNYVLSYLDKLKKDCKFYLNKECNIPETWYTVMNIYKEFLTENRFLVDAKTTADIKMPELLKTPNEEQLNVILNTIKDVINSGEFPKLFEVKDLII